MEVDSPLSSKKGDKDPSPSPKTGKENISSSNVEIGTTPTYELDASAPGTSTDESTGTTGKFNTLSLLSKQGDVDERVPHIWCLIVVHVSRPIWLH